MSRPDGDQSAIAITGLACRFPGDGHNLESFWDSICNGTSAWSEIPRERFNPDAFRYGITTRGGHFLKEDISLFDANFFNISHAEASAMDPQQRLMVEVVYEALEAAGYRLQDMAGTSTGVFMGQFTSDYKESIYRDVATKLPFSVTGLQAASLSNRISWLLDLHGPSFTLDTACSSSLVALHLACQSLRCGESDMAIVGGCNLMINPEMFISETGQGFLSPDGKCKTFDISANGYGRGEGFAVVILKRVDNAISDRDPIRAVIRGSASNQDGHTKGFTLPSSDAQASLIRSAYASAGLGLAQTGYVEAHGTGTKAGDLEETTALAKTISAALQGHRELIVGSVKPNIGHTEGAAGLAGVVKSVMMLETGIIPPNIHFHNPNPAIKFDQWKIRVPTSKMPWPVDGIRRISVNSFGYGGTNAHIVLDDTQSYLVERGLGDVYFPEASKCSESKKPNGTTGNGYRGPTTSVQRLFAITAQDKGGIERVKKELATFVAEKAKQMRNGRDGDYLEDLAYTLNDRRSHLQWKSFCIASSLDELCEELKSKEPVVPVHMSSSKPRLGFVFTGQGAQWARMGIELLNHRTFRDSIAAADAYLHDELGCSWSIAEELAKGKSTSKVNLGSYSQVLCSVLQVALIELLKEWNIVPSAVVGHSSGEIAAAYCLGALSREDAWKVAYFRGLLSSRVKDSGLDGAMMAVGMSEQEAFRIIAQFAPDEVHVACVNSPKSVTLSGDVDGIDKVHMALQAEGIFARKLAVDTAYHSPHMQTVAQEYLEELFDISTSTYTEDIKMYSSVSGNMIQPGELGPAYWVRNLISTVQFAPAIQNLVRPSELPQSTALNNPAVDILIEVGPHPALQGPSTQSLEAIGIRDVPYYSVLSRHQPATRTALNLAGSLFARGCPVDLRQINQLEREPLALVDLPPYPWNHAQSHWAESRVAKEYRLREPAPNSLLGAPSPSLVAGERVWRGHLSLSEQPWMADHKIHGSVLYPAAGFISMAIEGALSDVNRTQNVTSITLRDIHLISALIVPEDGEIEYTVCLKPHHNANREPSSTWTEFIVSSCSSGKVLERNCVGLIMLDHDPENSNEEGVVDAAMFGGATSICTESVDPAEFYRHLALVGLEYGPDFQNLTGARAGINQSYCTVDIPDVGLSMSPRRHLIHPGTLDAIFHIAFVALSSSPSSISRAMVPKSIDRIVISTNMPSDAGIRLKGISNVSRQGFNEIMADILVSDEPNKSQLLQVYGLCCTEIKARSDVDNNGTEVARAICSKIVWRPYIDLLKPSEQKRFLENTASLVSQHRGAEIADPEVPFSSILSQLISLLHHSNPGISVSEIVADSMKYWPYVSQSGNAETLKTADWTLWCSDGDAKQAIQDICPVPDTVGFELCDLTQMAPLEGRKLQLSDLIIVPVFMFDTMLHEQLIRNAKPLMATTGRLCLVVPSKLSHGIVALGQAAGLNDWIEFNDVEDSSEQELALLVGSRSNVEEIQVHHDEEVIILQSPNPSSVARDAALRLTKSLLSVGYGASIVQWATGKINTKDKNVISLLEIDRERPFLENLSHGAFTEVKSLILESSSLLWVSSLHGAGHSMITGLARVVRNEEPGLSFRTLHADVSDSSSTAAFADSVLRIWGNNTKDSEFMVQDGLIHISRVVEDGALNRELHLLDPQHRSSAVANILENAGTLKLCIQNPGLLDSLCFEPDSLPSTHLKDDEIEITVVASSLNFRDVMTVMGQLPNTQLGHEAAGIVCRIGATAKGFRVGDRVVMLSPGAIRTVHRGKASACLLIPDEITFEEAATIPVVHGTAWYALVKLAGVISRKGQSILIHAASGGVGQAAVQIAQHAGMEIFATVGSEIKRRLLRETYGIPDDHIFNSRDLSFVAGISRMTKGRGVDVILNSLSGESLRQTWHCIAPFGSFVEIGSRDILANASLDMRPFLQDASFTFFDLKRIAQERPDILTDIMRESFDLIQKGITRPVTPITTYPVSEVEAAFRLMQTGKHLGKIVLQFTDQRQSVPIVNQLPKQLLKLNSDAAYVLVGGLGGVGRSLSRTLVDGGARKLCFLSRSGAESQTAQRFVQELQSMHIEVLVCHCDVSDPQAVQDAVALCSKKLGCVRGVIQCAMVLRDTLFRNMTYSQWVESTQPKVQGTWNMHNSIREVDFFITLSSFAGIFGNRGQANYAAAGSYQDAISHFRRAQGLRAVTIDLGIMRDVGVLEEKGMLDNLRDWAVPYGIRERELANIVSLAIAGDISGTISPQILTGLATGGSAITAGIDMPWYLDDAKFSIMSKIGTRGSTRADSGQDKSVQGRLSNAESEAEAINIVKEALVARVAKMLQTTAEEIDTNRFLHSYGIDSLVAIEVVSWALNECKARITVFDILASVPIALLAHTIASKSALLNKLLDRS